MDPAAADEGTTSVLVVAPERELPLVKRSKTNGKLCRLYLRTITAHVIAVQNNH